jgi:hypothetical protein
VIHCAVRNRSREIHYRILARIFSTNQLCKKRTDSIRGSLCISRELTYLIRHWKQEMMYLHACAKECDPGDKESCRHEHRASVLPLSCADEEGTVFCSTCLHYLCKIHFQALLAALRSDARTLGSYSGHDRVAASSLKPSPLLVESEN